MRSLLLASLVLLAAIAGFAFGTTLPGSVVVPASPQTQGLARNLPRHASILMSGVPVPYQSVSNPLPRSHGSIARGAAVYAQHCASCHGATGAGDGPAGRALKSPPGDLAWLSQVPTVEWEPFMYWSVAEGGAPFGSAMPAYKDALAPADIWAVIGFIQARLPQSPR